jgi:hypothetical protein
MICETYQGRALSIHSQEICTHLHLLALALVGDLLDADFDALTKQ